MSDSSFTSLIIQEYSKSQYYCGKIDGADVQWHQGNSVCGDDITIYLQVQDQHVLTYRFDGNTSLITHASASFLGDLIVGASIMDVLHWTEQTMLDHDFVVSTRRRRASVIAILSCRNGLHCYLQDGLQDDFDDILDGYPDLI